MDQPVPSCPPPGPIDVAALALLRRALVRPEDLVQVYEPFYGVGSCAGQIPLSAQRLAAKTGVSADRTRWITSRTREFAGEVGPPESLVHAIGDLDTLGVIGLPHLVGRWLTNGLIRGALHQLAMDKLARLFGVQSGFRVLRDDHWQWPIVVADRVLPAVPAVARSIRRRLRWERMLTIDQVSDLTTGLTADEVRRLAEACWVFVGSSDLVVDLEPHGIDQGIGRLLAGALRPPQVAEILEGLGRWYNETNTPSWTDERSLATYLRASPLYAQRGDGWVASGGWAQSTAVDEALLAVGDRDRACPRALLVEELVARGWTRGSSEHAVAVSPVIRTAGRGFYCRIGTVLWHGPPAGSRPAARVSGRQPL